MIDLDPASGPTIQATRMAQQRQTHQGISQGAEDQRAPQRGTDADLALGLAGAAASRKSGRHQGHDAFRQRGAEGREHRAGGGLA